MTTRSLCVTLILLGSTIAVVAQEAEADPISPRNANYTIDVKLDTDRRMLVGRQTVVWRNIQNEPTEELRFHLYWNAWRNNRSTWMLEAERRGRSVSLREDEWSWVEVDSVRLLPGDGYDGADLIASRRFAAPDDGNPDAFIISRSGDDVLVTVNGMQAYRAALGSVPSTDEGESDSMYPAHFLCSECIKKINPLNGTRLRLGD